MPATPALQVSATSAGPETRNIGAAMAGRRIAPRKADGTVMLGLLGVVMGVAGRKSSIAIRQGTAAGLTRPFRRGREPGSPPVWARVGGGPGWLCDRLFRGGRRRRRTGCGRHSRARFEPPFGGVRCRFDADRHGDAAQAGEQGAVRPRRQGQQRQPGEGVEASGREVDFRASVYAEGGRTALQVGAAGHAAGDLEAGGEFAEGGGFGCVPAARRLAGLRGRRQSFSAAVASMPRRTALRMRRRPGRRCPGAGHPAWHRRC